MAERPVRLVLPHQLFAAHLDAPDGTTFVLVEHDLLFRQYRFHTQKLVLHRASMRRFAARLRDRDFEVVHVETDGRTTSRAALARVLRDLAPTSVSVYDVVDDWLSRDLTAALADAGHELTSDDVMESPNFLTTRAQAADAFSSSSKGQPRMQHFYSWQRRRLDVLMDGDQPRGGKWSYDEDNRKKLPRGHAVPTVTPPERHPEVDEAIAWVTRAFPDNPGTPDTFAWPTSHAEAEVGLEEFLAERFHSFGPYEDALSSRHPHLFHSLLTPGLNVGLLSPRHVLRRALEVGEADDVPLASLEGFVRQLVGWREYMRASYHLHGRRLRTRNHLEHARPLAPGWWTAQTGLAPVDHVVGQVLESGYAHHIERLMVLGNAMCLLRTDPEAVHEWFMELFVDAYDWVMVPNVHAMSQFAAGGAITTKPYVSGSNYLRTMSDYASAGWGEDWQADWDALYWTFVRDHHDVFAGNPRSQMIASLYDRMEPATKAAHTRRAEGWLT
ncbi:MAG: cryptochrome/photolyase family protein [Nocardioides sp.]|uniref:cryptochrome/photolyase family protein n=1 Tax=Nocardioides sp. TaxID=35761 RepID=UPI000C97DDC3|nr:cryptochrome/photolyase family protein [Nocardioides sp.]MAS56850.1 cryptochrome/photolyase family protein [Pimelobacter sp.]MDE0777515.1 cryptochrome/photolyase family protein [Nocardioides sp.]